MAKVEAEIGAANYAVKITASRHALASDEPVARGGQDTGPAPYELLLAGLASCTIITLRMYAERKGWTLGTIHAELEHTKDGKRSKITRTLRFGAPLSDEHLARLAEIAEKTPVTLTLKEGADIATHIVPPHPAETAEHLDERLDEALEESFPASDPISVTREERS
ncbi:OsmC family protein [Kaistia dalseonensis]|uniref:Redox protein n=1 Tax=Kaistia dalseonensis TaxID=410840 RepID=A0ABU0H494_9HYPH|nr:OsmC family protein [Kaistia dalseonensis]MCX5494538.1 OsmC family protein [Kaistia dalseonensis]MDQ0437117.1 putative redox protein [Kaistia dalseonensis]